MNEIYLESKDFNFVQKFSGYESNIFSYNNNSLIKIFKTNNNSVLNNKLQKLKILYTLQTDDVLPIDLIYIDGIFKGYRSNYRRNFYPINGFEQKKKEKYIILKKILEKINYYHSLNIYFGDLHEKNILYNKSTRQVILCDLDNFIIDDLDFDIKNNYQKKYLKNNNTIKYMDEFIFNLLTISYIQNISYSYVFDFLLNNGLKGILNTPENYDIIYQMLNYSQEFSGELLINHTRKKILH